MKAEITNDQALRLAVEALKEKVKQNSWDANLYDHCFKVASKTMPERMAKRVALKATYPKAAKDSQRCQQLRAAIKKLKTMMGKTTARAGYRLTPAPARRKDSGTRPRSRRTLPRRKQNANG